MENKSERDTDLWLREKRFKQSPGGPGYYLSKPLSSKESFNFGKIPFGSSIDRSAIKGSALQSGNIETPGPGQYQDILSISAQNQSRNINKGPYHRGGFVKIQSRSLLPEIGGIQGQAKATFFRSPLNEFTPIDRQQDFTLNTIDAATGTSVLDQSTLKVEIKSQLKDQNNHKRSTLNLKVSGGKSPIQNLKLLSPQNAAESRKDLEIQVDSQAFLGPGLYDPNHSAILRASPSVKFQPIQSDQQTASKSSPRKNQVFQNQSIRKQVEDYLSGILGQERFQSIPNEDSLLESQTQKTKNQSAVFQSLSNRTNFANSITPGPGSYVLQNPLDISVQTQKYANANNVNFGSYSKRSTDFVFRDMKSPYKNNTNIDNPPIGKYSAQIDKEERKREVLRKYVEGGERKVGSSGSILFRGISKKQLSPERQEYIKSIQLNKTIANIGPGPGQYHKEKEEIESIADKYRINTNVAFNSQTPRFKDKNNNNNNTSLLMPNIQNLNHDNHHNKIAPNQALKPQEQSIFKSKTSRVFPNLIQKQKDFINKAEENQQRFQYEFMMKEKKRTELLEKYKLDSGNNGVSFNASSPRFKDKKRFKIMTGMSNCPILGVNSLSPKVEYEEERGPGSYDLNNGIFDQKQQTTRNHQKGSSSFLASDRDQKSYIKEQLNQYSFNGKIGEYHHEEPFTKRSFNVALQQKKKKKKPQQQ